jgi:prefoldin subunit 5
LQRNERENLQIQIGKELNIREMLERQLIELNEDMQSLENDKHQLNNQLDELRQQLQSRDRQIQTYQVSRKRRVNSFKDCILYTSVFCNHTRFTTNDYFII